MLNKIKKKFKRNEKGQSLVEILIAIGLISLLIPAILSGVIASRGGQAQDIQRLTAVEILKDSQEAVRSMYTRDWELIETNGTYHPAISTDRWVLNSGATTSNGFTTSVVIGDVLRDSGGAIVPSGGIVDPSTKEVVITVSWSTPFSSSISSTNYYSRFVNFVRLETTEEEFTRGATSSGTFDTAITSTGDGEVLLASGAGGGDWCSPAPIIDEYDLPKSGVANAISAIEGKVSAGTGDNASGVSFADVTVDIDLPPNPQPDAEFDGYKTNDVFGETDYAYLGTDTNSKEIVIIDLNDYSDPPTNSKYLEVGYFDAPGNGDGDVVATLGNYGYMASGSNFYIFDLTSKSGSRSQVNTSALGLSGTAQKVIADGGYVYVVTDSSSNQLQIIDVSDPANPTIPGELTLAGGDGRDVDINATATRAYVATENSSSQDEFFIVDITSKSSPVLVSGGTFNTDGMDPTGIGVVTGNRAIIVGTGGTDQYQVLNINDENAPVICGTHQVPSGINGLATVLQGNGLAFSYIITGDSGSELKIILGGAGGGGDFSTSGVFESYVFEAGSEAAWNNFIVTSSIPQNTTLRFQIAIKPSISNRCEAVTFNDNDFVGEDGQTTSFYSSAGGSIPFITNSPTYNNPGRCMKYRAYLDTTDVTQSPVLFDISLNYSL